ncbi:hypothetical protein [Rufibacter roseus]|uniref:Uncharacterized protein n=1 Tax=Rufibacter roseus TaxID=1567108 RepID=A0ABW2DJQ2_9BACT|nr:hypothetical protein [Rufibacter roseus]
MSKSKINRKLSMAMSHIQDILFMDVTPGDKAELSLLFDKINAMRDRLVFSEPVQKGARHD